MRSVQTVQFAHAEASRVDFFTGSQAWLAAENGTITGM